MTNIIKNQIYDVKIEGYTSEGLGVCRIEGHAVFVPKTIAGEQWRVKIVKANAAAIYARPEQLLEASPERIAPLCPVYGKCGGCTLMHMSYAEELRFKLGRVNDALRHIGKQTLQADEIIGADSLMNYRNKGIYAFAGNGTENTYGFYRDRSHDIIETAGCCIQNSFTDSAAAAMFSFMQQHGIPAYDEETGKGVVRHIYCRVAMRTEDAVIVIIAARGFGSLTNALVDHLRVACPRATGIVLNINKQRGNALLTGDFYTLWGKETITDILSGFRFEIGPRAFYQINPPQAEKLYARAVEYAFPGGGGTALDLYCGAGTITLCLSRKADRVYGAEIIAQAIENAKENACRNKVENAFFLCADSGEAATAFSAQGIKPDVIVVDPPRKGMDETAIGNIAAMQPDRIAYVSCNPSTLARDILLLNRYGYSLQKVTAVDMFPRTSHVETVCLLSKKQIIEE